MSQESFTPDLERKRLTEERVQAEEALMAKVPAHQKEWFGKLLQAARLSASWSEDHTPFCELAQNAVTRKVVWEAGKRFARAGVIDEPFDIFMLMPWEIRKAIVPMERVDYRSLARWRKEEWHKALRLQPPPFLGQKEKLNEIVRKDPIISVVGAARITEPSSKDILCGASGAPGIAEGEARVIMSESDMGEIQPGEVLVAPTTAAPWIAVFHVVSGVVTDMGGSMAHAVIMGREFGIPVVTGTLEGTTKIKTGDRVRVDGNNMVVYLL
jgi:phosphohistidine swiveling domain-containing protein